MNVNEYRTDDLKSHVHFSHSIVLVVQDTSKSHHDYFSLMESPKNTWT